MAEKKTAFQEKNLLPTVQFGGGSIMLWGFVASKGTGILVRVEGRMYFTQYHQIFKNNVQESVERLKLCRSWLFQQDNDTEYCSKSTKRFMHRHKCNVLERPSQSPDLKIISNLWFDLKRAVLTEREKCCKEEWPKIPAARIQGCISGYKKHTGCYFSKRWL